MNAWATVVVALAFFIAIFDFIYFNYYFLVEEPARGYLRPAFKGFAAYYVASLAVRVFLAFVVGGFPFWHASSFGRVLLASFVVGATVVSAQSGVDVYFLKHGTEKKYRELFRVLSRLNVFTRKRYAIEIQRLKERDNYDCSNGIDYWDIGLDEKQVRRRLRILWERYQRVIIGRRDLPGLVGPHHRATPAQRFYLLIAHFRRDGLREQLRNMKIAEGSWNGRERRRDVGTPQDRRNEMPGDAPARWYD